LNQVLLQHGRRLFKIPCALLPCLPVAVPGKHTGADMHKWGHLRLRATLNREPPFPSAFRGAPLAAQYSSLGSLDDKWLTEEFKVSLAAGRCGGGNGGCAALLQ
jgi:hypothetical protein